MHHGHSPWKPMMIHNWKAPMGREERIPKAKEASGRATVRELNEGKSASMNCSGLLKKPLPPDLPLNHLKTDNYCA